MEIEHKPDLAPLPEAALRGSAATVPQSVGSDAHHCLQTPAQQEEQWKAAAVQAVEEWRRTQPEVAAAVLGARLQQAQHSIRSAFDAIERQAAIKSPLSDEARWLYDNHHLLSAAFVEARESLEPRALAKMQRSSKSPLPVLSLPYAAARSFIEAAEFDFSERAFEVFFSSFQVGVSLRMAEIWALKPMMVIVILEKAATAAEPLCASAEISLREPAPAAATPVNLSTLVTSIRALNQADWTDLFEKVSAVETVLRGGEGGVYSRMDRESRDLYRDAIEKLARFSKWREEDIARKSLELAQKAGQAAAEDPRLQERRAQVGYFLIDEGITLLQREIGYQAPFNERFERAIQEHGEAFYLLGIELTTVALIAFLLSALRPLTPVLAALLLLILPATEAATGLMNQLVTWLFEPRRLAKLDFSEGIPTGCATMVAIPTLLLSEAQVAGLVEELEIRYLANRDANLHFALVSDSPDAPEPSSERDKLVDLCTAKIEALNQKYAPEGKGSFFLFHRQRVFVESEGAWMGLERKRGKLLDLNRLLTGQGDSFPVKVGNLAVLPGIRYVITLDSDTQLPPDAAHRLVGAIAHPLNRAVIDAATNTVVEGYAILQPRVGVSIHSATRSRLARIYSGQTGFDIYTHATSDVYQDLFGEGSFTGKGIYEVETFQKVLWRRFPHNALLSHDLIEGSYARAGLVSDIEVIDDYPSHVSAYSRRKHRWTRGDWQIALWLFPRVPNYFGRWVPNPLRLISRWKILDNLRRSLVEISTLAFLLAGWFYLPGGPAYWTVVALILMTIPSYFELLLSLLRLDTLHSLKGWAKEVSVSFVNNQVAIFLNLAFLAHQAMVMTDAVVRTLIRLTWTRKRLLEWETAAQAEMRSKPRTPVETWLYWVPWFALAIGAVMALWRPRALPYAAPFLVLWSANRKLVDWLDRSLQSSAQKLTPSQVQFLRRSALLTWRYFQQWSSADCHWLIPDSVQESPPAVVQRLSPTNLGLLLNARLAALDLGYLTLPEFINQTRLTLDAARRLPRVHGHLLNWCDNVSLGAVAPHFVSTVDSGNLAGCLITLQEGCLEMITRPSLNTTLWQGLLDHLALLQSVAAKTAVPDTAPANCLAPISAADDPPQPHELPGRLSMLQSAVENLVTSPGPLGGEPAGEFAYWGAETLNRIRALRQWHELLHPLAHLTNTETPDGFDPGMTRDAWEVPLADLPALWKELASRPESGGPNSETTANAAVAGSDQVRMQMQASACTVEQTAAALRQLAADCEAWVKEMDFAFLFDRRRKLLSIGYDDDRKQVHPARYDLVASEARMAAFVAIAKGDVPQECWFRLGRAHTLYAGRQVLTSWTGTLFEYFMPALWMKTYAETLLEQTLRAVIPCQQEFACRQGRLWGVSEAAHAAQDSDGLYQYQAFGIPALALKPDVSSHVVAPYATFLCLGCEPLQAIENLQNMEAQGWLGKFGFYESADYDEAKGGGVRLIRSWMAHHQGMTLLAVANCLAGDSMIRRFHLSPSVIAVQRLLNERVPATIVATPPAFEPAADSSG
jgi:cyclic beta-1,2-glucan synthetase